MRQRNVAYYQQLKNVDEFLEMAVENVYQIIMGGELIGSTEIIWKRHKDGLMSHWGHGSKEDYKNDKINMLPAVTFSTSAGRSKDIDVTPDLHTGIINLDIDENTKDELDTFVEDVVPTLPYIEACGFSISGRYTGNRWANAQIEIPKQYEEIPDELKKYIRGEKWLDTLHKLYHGFISHLFEKEYGIIVGDAKDLKRARTLCFDEHLYLNEKAETIQMTELIPYVTELAKQKKEISGFENYNGETNPQKIMDWVIEQDGALEDGHRTHQLTRYYGICNYRGIPKEDAIEYASQCGGKYKEIGEDIYERYKNQKQTNNKLIERKFTDVENAKNFTELYSDSIRYCPSAKNWFVYNGKNWKLDEKQQIYCKAKDYIQGVIDKGIKNADVDLCKAGYKLQSKSKIENMIKLAQSEVPITPDEFDTDRWKINVGNGILNLKTGLLKQETL